MALKISDYLGRGEHNATHMDTLSTMTNLSEREVRRAVHIEREHGVLIMSGTAGYWLPATSNEVEGYYHFMKSRAIGTLKILKSARRYCRRKDAGNIEGQLDITDFINE